MATPCLTQSSSSLLLFNRTKTNISSSSIHFRCPNPKKNSSCIISLSKPFSHSISYNNEKSKTKKSSGSPSVSALIDNEQLASTTVPPSKEDGQVEIEGDGSAASGTQEVKFSRLYVCNLPSDSDISQLLHIFTPFGIVQSVEVSRDAKTGLSRGCGYVTMSSISEANAAIAALDGSDIGGREMRVTISVDVNNEIERRNIDALDSRPKKNFIFESPYKLYAGNLAWSVKPEDLRNLFCQFGTVVSARLLHDRKDGKSRVYGFLSFSSAAELEAAMILNGTEFRGRKMILREVLGEKET